MTSRACTGEHHPLQGGSARDRRGRGRQFGCVVDRIKERKRCSRKKVADRGVDRVLIAAIRIEKVVVKGRDFVQHITKCDTACDTRRERAGQLPDGCADRPDNPRHVFEGARESFDRALDIRKVAANFLQRFLPRPDINADILERAVQLFKRNVNLVAERPADLLTKIPRIVLKQPRLCDETLNQRTTGFAARIRCGLLDALGFPPEAVRHRRTGITTGLGENVFNLAGGLSKRVVDLVPKTMRALTEVFGGVLTRILHRRPELGSLGHDRHPQTPKDRCAKELPFLPL